MGSIHVIDRRLWQTADRERVVEDGHPEAAFLYATPGDEVPLAEAEHYGLVPAPKAEKAEGKPSTKVGDKPADKTGDKPADKG